MITFLFVNLAWVFFRANDVTSAMGILKTMFGYGELGFSLQFVGGSISFECGLLCGFFCKSELFLAELSCVLALSLCIGRSGVGATGTLISSLGGGVVCCAGSPVALA